MIFMKKSGNEKIKLVRNSTIEFLRFASSSKDTFEVRYEDETIWLTQKLMAKLFDVDVRTVNEHLKNIFKTGELYEDSVIRNFRITADDGKSYNTKHYDLDAIISVGYRVNSIRATEFRQWATKVLTQFAIKGYVINRERMENGDFLGHDYFEELLAQIREIRLSERRFYQKLTDIFATSLDYNNDAPTASMFFKVVQNKLHFGTHGHTASELIRERVDSGELNMGLTTWKNSPDGKISKKDVTIAKNYLTKDELESMGRIVNAALDLAEDRANRKIPMTMKDWSNWIDDFLKFDGREVLDNAGSISAENAKKHAEAEFEKFRVIQDKNYISDFDKEIKKVEQQIDIREGK